MELKNHWVNNDGVSIHYLDSNPNSNEEMHPFVIVPGLSETAEDYIPLLESLFPRRCVVVTLRGRGKSDAPQQGYALEDHIGDIESVVKHLALNQFILMGYSRGVSYALGYALTNLNSIKGLVIGDYPALHSQLPPGWVEFFSTLPPWREKPLVDRMTEQSLYGLQNESRQVLFWDQLYTIHCPVLVIRGGKPGAALSEEGGSKYVELLPNANLVVFEDCDHNIFKPSIERFANTAQAFLESIDS